MKRTGLNPRNLTCFFRTHAATITIMLAVVFTSVLIVGVLLVNASDQSGPLTDWDTSPPADTPTNIVSDHTDTNRSRLADITSWTPTNNQYDIIESDEIETSTELFQTCSIDQNGHSSNGMAMLGIASENSSFMKSGITDLLDNRHTPLPTISNTFANSGTDTWGLAGTNGLDADMRSYLGTYNTELAPNPVVVTQSGSKTKHK